MSTYETDFYRWTQETAELLKQRRFIEVDLQALIDEVESVGRNGNINLHAVVKAGASRLSGNERI